MSTNETNEQEKGRTERVPRLRSKMDWEDWQDIAESEFVDYNQSPLSTKIGFVFEHDELGLHGFTFDMESNTLAPAAFEEVGDDE